MQGSQAFLDSFFEQISHLGIDISQLTLDHIAYQAASAQDYDALKPSFMKQGKEVSEEMVGGRRVGIFELHQPLKYKNYTINAIELVEPRPDQTCDSMFQHAEFIWPQDFQILIEKYPHLNWDTSSMNRADFPHLKFNFDNGLTLKFLHQPILDMVREATH
ncbi:MAG TPA: VOC family protein [Vitreimonas sp.]|nr:VOC family protein [Vitreimonas sp.]